MLGLGRALGETIAVYDHPVQGPTPKFQLLVSSTAAQTFASKIANNSVGVQQRRQAADRCLHRRRPGAVRPDLRSSMPIARAIVNRKQGLLMSSHDRTVLARHAGRRTSLFAHTAAALRKIKNNCWPPCWCTGSFAIASSRWSGCSTRSSARVCTPSPATAGSPTSQRSITSTGLPGGGALNRDRRHGSRQVALTTSDLGADGPCWSASTWSSTAWQELVRAG